MRSSHINKSAPKVLVTGVGGGSVGHQILKALLLLAGKYDIVVADADRFAFGLYEVENRYCLPFASDLDYMPSLLGVIQQEGIDVLLPGTEAETAVISHHVDAIREAGCVALVHPPEIIELWQNKWSAYNWLTQHDLETARTVRANHWQLLVSEVGFPIIGKPSEKSGGSKNVSILKNEKEVEEYLDESTRLVDDVIFQAYEGSSDGEYTVGVLTSKDGDLIDSIVIHRKLTGLSLGSQRVIGGREYTLSTGYSQGFIVEHPLIQQTCERLVQEIGTRGATNIQCRLVGDRVVVFEVHPRFSGTTSIRALAGYNEPDVWIRNVLNGEKFGRLNYRTNVAAIRSFKSVLVPIAEMEKVPQAEGIGRN